MTRIAAVIKRNWKALLAAFLVLIAVSLWIEAGFEGTDDGPDCVTCWEIGR